jgi:hypothetical protein
MEQPDKTLKKERTLVVEAHVVAYLGHYMNYVKTTIRKKAELCIANTQKPSVPSQSSPKYTASSHNHS